MIIPHHYHAEGRELYQNLMKYAHYQSQTRSPLYKCKYQVWWKSTEIYSSNCFVGDKLHEITTSIYSEEYFKMLSAEIFAQHAKY